VTQGERHESGYNLDIVYNSPSGQAVVAKLPLVMEDTSTLMQQRMLSIMPKIQEVAKDTAAQIKGQPGAGPKSSS
jgi:uncharacterized protein